MKYFRRKTLFSKILFSCLVPFVIMLVFLLLFVSNLLYKSAKQSAREDAIFYSNQISTAVKSVFMDNSAELLLTGEQLRLLDRKSPVYRKEVTKILHDFLASHPGLFSTWVIFNKGVVSKDRFTVDLVIQDGVIEPIYDLDNEDLFDGKEDPDWIHVPLKTGQSFYDNLDEYDYFGDGNPIPTSTVSSPIKEGDTVIGVIGMDALYYNYYSFLDELQLENKREVLLIDTKGNILYYMGKKDIGKNIFEKGFRNEEKMREVLREGRSYGVEDRSLLFGGESFMYLCPVNIEDAREQVYMLVDMPQSVLYSDAWVISGTVLGVGGLMCLVLTLSVYLSIAHSVKTIKSITNLANKIIEGDYDIDYSSYMPRTKSKSDEIVVLQNSIVTMLEDLRSHIKERERNNRELKTAKEKAEESNHLKSAFLANMSHEIRTPLNAIVGFSSILGETEDPAERKEYVELIETNNTLLLQLVDDILDLSKVEAGTAESSYSCFELSEMMKSQESAMLLSMKRPNVKLAFESPGFDLCICSEKNRLIQVLTNFLSNAIKFTEEGSITFGYRLTGEGNDFVCFYVTDTGKGIPKDKHAAIFERFVKLDDFVQGTGLGLSISQVIVERLGGEIGVESEMGKGSTFWFTVPYKSC